jgi:hypothetical protein
MDRKKMKYTDSRPSLENTHKFMGFFRNRTLTRMTDSERHIDYSVSEGQVHCSQLKQ